MGAYGYAFEKGETAMELLYRPCVPPVSISPLADRRRK